MKRLGILVLGLLINAHILYAQNQFVIDSLETELRNTKSDTVQAQLYLDLSKQYFGNNLVTSLEYVDKGISVIDTTVNTIQLIRIYRAKGGILTYLGSYQEANQYFLKALRVAQSRNEIEELLPIYSNLGVIHENMNQDNVALEYYFKALDILPKINNLEQSHIRSRLGALYDNLGSIYMKKKEYESADKYFEKTLEITQSSGEVSLRMYGLRNLGESKMEQGEEEKAFEYFTEALALAKDLNRDDEISICYYHLASYYLSTNKLKEALEVATNCYQYAGRVGSVSSLQKATQIMYKVQFANGNYKLAFENLLTNKELSDSLLNESVIDKIARAQSKYEYDRLVEKQLLDQETVRLRNIMINSFLLLGLLIVVALFFLLRGRFNRIKIQKASLEREVELKNKELTTNVLYLVKKNDYLNSVSEKLLELKKSAKTENKLEIQKIINDLQQSSDQEVWEEFEMRFQQVHNDFYTNLQKKFPDLSMAERKLAAFLRLDMTSKEIASITGQSVKSLEVARARLRKKLGLTNQDVNLVTFLLEI